MTARLFLAAASLTSAAAIAACQSSGPYGTPAQAALAAGGRPAPVVSTRAPYPPGHEYSVPESSVPASSAPACDPAAATSSHEADAGPIACEMDASVP